MKKTSYEEFVESRHKTQQMYPEHYKLSWVEDTLKRVQDQRSRSQEEFPHTLVVKGDWVEYDIATRWCWQHFGPKDGACGEYSSEYPACPLVLETKYMLERPPHISEEDWEEEWHDGYRNPGEHSHEGTWTCLHWMKTGYDYGVGEYRFANEADRDALAAVIEGLGHGEKYGNYKTEEEND